MMRILKSKKGIALENAILFLMVIFSLCFLIASFTLIGHYQGEIEKVQLAQRVELDQIGEDFLKDPDGFTDKSEKYSCYPTTVVETIDDVEVKYGVLRVEIGRDSEVVLYVKVELDSEGKPKGDPIVWRYSEP